MPRPERPLDHSSDDPVVRFAGDLRALRERAGNPGYRMLAAAAGYSVTTLAEAAAGRTLPTLAVLRAYVRACGGDVGAWEQRWHDLTATLAASAPDPDAPSPYVGLRELAGETVPPDARFSPDGRRLVAADENGVVLYDIRGPAPVVLARIDVPAIVAGFSPDGRVVQIVAPSGPIMLWSTVSHTWLASLPGTAQPAEFSPDGRFLAARGGNDGTIRLWDVRDPAEPVPTAALGTGFPLAFSPDGHTLAVLAADGSLRLRETDLRRAIATVCATAPPLSRPVWQRCLPGHAYRPPCAGPAGR